MGACRSLTWSVKPVRNYWFSQGKFIQGGTMDWRCCGVSCGSKGYGGLLEVLHDSLSLDPFSTTYILDVSYPIYIMELCVRRNLDCILYSSSRFICLGCSVLYDPSRAMSPWHGRFLVLTLQPACFCFDWIENIVECAAGENQEGREWFVVAILFLHPFEESLHSLVVCFVFLDPFRILSTVLYFQGRFILYFDVCLYIVCQS